MQTLPVQPAETAPMLPPSPVANASDSGDGSFASTLGRALEGMASLPQNGPAAGANASPGRRDSDGNDSELISRSGGRFDLFVTNAAPSATLDPEDRESPAATPTPADQAGFNLPPDPDANFSTQRAVGGSSGRAPSLTGGESGYEAAATASPGTNPGEGQAAPPGPAISRSGFRAAGPGALPSGRVGPSREKNQANDQLASQLAGILPGLAATPDASSSPSAEPALIGASWEATPTSASGQGSTLESSPLPAFTFSSGAGPHGQQTESAGLIAPSPGGSDRESQAAFPPTPLPSQAVPGRAIPETSISGSSPSALSANPPTAEGGVYGGLGSSDSSSQPAAVEQYLARSGGDSPTSTPSHADSFSEQSEMTSWLRMFTDAQVQTGTASASLAGPEVPTATAVGSNAGVGAAAIPPSFAGPEGQDAMTSGSNPGEPVAWPSTATEEAQSEAVAALPDGSAQGAMSSLVAPAGQGEQAFPSFGPDFEQSDPSGWQPVRAQQAGSAVSDLPGSSPAAGADIVAQRNDPQQVAAQVISTGSLVTAGPMIVGPQTSAAGGLPVETVTKGESVEGISPFVPNRQPKSLNAPRISFGQDISNGTAPHPLPLSGSVFDAGPNVASSKGASSQALAPASPDPVEPQASGEGSANGGSGPTSVQGSAPPSASTQLNGTTAANSQDASANANSPVQPGEATGKGREQNGQASENSMMAVSHQAASPALTTPEPATNVLADHAPAIPASQARVPTPPPTQGVRQPSATLSAWQSYDGGPGRIVQSASLLDASRGAEMRVALRTVTLGPMEVHAALNDGSLGAEIRVQGQDAHTLLSAGLPSLERALGERNLTIDKIAVYQDQVGSGMSGGGNPDQRSGSSPSTPHQVTRGDIPPPRPDITSSLPEEDETINSGAGLSIRV